MSVERLLKELQSQTSRSSSPALCLSITIVPPFISSTMRSLRCVKSEVILESAWRLSVQAGREFELREAPSFFYVWFRTTRVQYQMREFCTTWLEKKTIGIQKYHQLKVPSILLVHVYTTCIFSLANNDVY